MGERAKALQRINQSLVQLKQLSELAIPPIFKGSTELSIVRDAQQQYDNPETANAAYAKLKESYAAQSDVPLSPPEPAAIAALQTSNGFSLQTLLEKNSLEEYRRETGLSQLRDKLKEKLLSNISFEKGIEKLREHLDKRGTSSSADLGDQLKSVDASKILPETMKLGVFYPDISAEEVAWLSLTDIPSQFLFDQSPPFYFPVGIADIDLDGLRLAYGTIDERTENKIVSLSAEKILGLKGISGNYTLARFDHNVSQVLKALVLLSINDQDLYDRIWEEQDVIPLQRGDAQLIKSRLKQDAQRYNLPDNFESLRLEELIGKHVPYADIDLLRHKVNSYFASSHFENPLIKNSSDFVKLMGLLSRLPSFVESKIPFNGYVKFYGKTVQFIDSNGSVSDSVPLADHLINNCSYQFHERFSSISTTDEILKGIFQNIRQNIADKVVYKQECAVDAVQRSIFEKYNIFVPTSITSQTKKVGVLEMYNWHSVSDTHVERTVKFGLEELLSIKRIFDALPSQALTNISSIYKEISDESTIDAFLSGLVKGGHYELASKKICISLPFETPSVTSELEFVMYSAITDKNKKKKMHNLRASTELHKAHFDLTLLHEIGESIWAMISEEKKKEWLAIGGEDKKPENFLTPYARTSRSEDFCDSFAIYYIRGVDFRARAEKNSLIKAKYEFMNTLWNLDGNKREFSHSINLPLHQIAGKPEDDFTKLSLKERVRTIMKEQDNERKVRSGSAVLSYEELASRVEAQEDNGMSFNQAGREISKEYRENWKQEEKERGDRIREFVEMKKIEMLSNAGLHLEMDQKLPYFLYYGMRDDAVKYLREEGAKPQKAKKIAENLIKLYSYFKPYLVSPSPQKASELSEEGIKILGELAKLKNERLNPDQS